MFTPTPAHEAIFNFILTGEGSAIIDAVAGAGKTTTLVECFSRIQGNAIFLAFNKSIATALAARCPQNVSARTFHSLCYMPVLRSMKLRTVDSNKIDRLLSELLTDAQARLYGAYIKRLIGLARNAGLDAIEPLTGERLYDLVDHHCLQLDSERGSEAEAIELARRTLEASNRDVRAVDFDDLLYLAVKNGVLLPKFDWVFVDEAQDTNAIQRAILRKLFHPHSRLVAVGDAAQSIYGFRGADSEAMNLLADEFHCERFPLSVTYRCAKNIVTKAQQYVPTITAAPAAPEGAVLNVGAEWKLTELRADDLMICRNVKPLIAVGYAMLRARLPVKIMGREIGEGLIGLLNRCARGARGLDEALAALEQWRDREMEKALSKHQDAKAESIEDRANTLLLLAGELPESDRSVNALTQVLRDLFTDSGPCPTLATIHKAKGLEAQRVWWLCPGLCPSPWARLPWQQQQESNIIYVAITRAALTLVMADVPKAEEGQRQ